MTSHIRSKRHYNSTRRQEQALHTRRQIIEAARSLFIARGYAGATIDAIAEQAEVAVETVYAAFGSKRVILSKLLDMSLVGDDLPVPLLEREGPREVMRGTDQHRQIELFADDMYEIMSRVAPIFEIMRVAAKTEPDIAEMLQSILDSRAQNLALVVRAIKRNGPLRAGLTLEAAAETVWMLTSAEVFLLLNSDRGWPVEKYKRWLTDAITRLLLP